MTTEALLDALGRALPLVYKYEADHLCLAHALDAEPGDARQLIEAVASLPRTFPVENDDALREGWSETARGVLLRLVRARPAGRDRIEALCEMAPWITPAEREEALAGILGGASPAMFWGDRAVCGNDLLHARLLATMPDEAKERWVTHRTRGAKASFEIQERRTIEHWPADAVRRLCEGLEEEAKPHGIVPWEYALMAPHVPADVRDRALQACRARPEDSGHDLLLSAFPDHLTAEEQQALVNPPRLADDAALFSHLEYLEPALFRLAPGELRRRWFARLMALGDDRCAVRALMRLAPWLEGPERQAALDRLVEQALARDAWWELDWVTALLGDDVMPPLAVAVASRPDQEDAARWMFAAIAVRPHSVQGACFKPLLRSPGRLSPRALVAFATHAHRWLDERTGHAFARGLAHLLAARPDVLPPVPDQDNAFG